MNAATAGPNLGPDLIRDGRAVEHAAPVIGVDASSVPSLLERLRAPEHDQLVAGPDRGVGLRVELHPAVLPLNADDDDAVALPQVRVEKRPVGERRTRAMAISSIASSRLSELVASSTKSTTAGRSAVCAICTAPI